LSLFGHNFCSQAPIEKNYIPMNIISFSIFQKISKNHDKKSAHRYLPKIPFVPRRDNGLLGVKKAGVGQGWPSCPWTNWNIYGIHFHTWDFNP